MTGGEQAAHAAGRRELMGELVTAGLIRDGALYYSGEGKGVEEIRQVRNRLERALRRESLSGQKLGRKQAINDVLRVIEGKKARYLSDTPKGRKIRGLLRQLRRALL